MSGGRPPTLHEGGGLVGLSSPRTDKNKFKKVKKIKKIKIYLVIWNIFLIFAKILIDEQAVVKI